MTRGAGSIMPVPMPAERRPSQDERDQSQRELLEASRDSNRGEREAGTQVVTPGCSFGGKKGKPRAASKSAKSVLKESLK